MNILERNIENEVMFKTSRSGGKGGQNVNKVETKVEAVLNIPASNLLLDEEKNIIVRKLAGKIDTEGNIRSVSQAYRSQLKNKREALGKLIDILEKALVKEKKRKKTRPSKEAKEKRIKEKKLKSEKKQFRKLPPVD